MVLRELLRKWLGSREISLSSGRRGGGPALGFDSSPGRSSKYNGFHEYSNSKFGRSGDGRMGFAERYFSADGMASGTKTHLGDQILNRGTHMLILVQEAV